MASSFRHIPNGWRNYIQFARAAAADGDEDMESYIKAYDALTAKERRSVMPEQVCDLANVKPHVVMGQVTAQLWLSNSNEGMQIAAIAHPKVMESMTYLAGLKTPDTHKERELHLRTLGKLPDKHGTALVVNVNTQQTSNTANFTSRNGGATLKSFKDDILEMEQITDGDDENVIDISTGILEPVSVGEDDD